MKTFRPTEQELEAIKRRIGKGTKVSFGLGARNEKKRNKYNAEKNTVDGIVFDSRHEAEVYKGLWLRQKAGEISQLMCHYPLRIEVNGEHVFNYEADFRFYEGHRLVYMDAKGYKKGAAYQLFRLKKTIVKAALGIEIEEV
jgi:hypothetical protein